MMFERTRFANVGSNIFIYIFVVLKVYRRIRLGKRCQFVIIGLSVLTRCLREIFSRICPEFDTQVIF